MTHLTIQKMAKSIAVALKADGISQAEFARRSGRSAKHVNQVLNGRAIATVSELDYWAYLLDRRWEVSLQPMAETAPSEEP